MTLPDIAIAVVHRSDGSGTTNAFTTYLDTVEPGLAHDGRGRARKSSGRSASARQGNDGVATGVKQTPGAVGYVELQYATTAKLTSAYVKNADGNSCPGSTDGVTAAAEAAMADFPADMRQAPIINGAGPDTYPIASYTYLLVYQDQTNADKGQALVSFICWALTEGQAAESAPRVRAAPSGGPAEGARPRSTRSRPAASPIWP